MYPLWPRKPQSVGFTLFGWITTKPTEATAAGTFEQYVSDQVGGMGEARGGSERARTSRGSGWVSGAGNNKRTDVWGVAACFPHFLPACSHTLHIAPVFFVLMTVFACLLACSSYCILLLPACP